MANHALIVLIRSIEQATTIKIYKSNSQIILDNRNKYHQLEKEFEQLYCISDPVPGKGLHYKLFEELYSAFTTEKYRSLFKNAKLKTTKSDKTKVTIIAKHTMPFSPSFIRAKNVRITVTCTEYEKLYLLFKSTEISNEEISNKDNYKEEKEEEMNNKTSNEIAGSKKKL
ncbi:39225_t:CDS:2 [Gigaspora margarita]|uniref:39225_t:CDS:1 n=1 Tax=Gigaspora margarita TaxID=4874 RepID=A0ABN7UW06_GIGMA|nr:39225_t:CDS:2 [Gigaspora margarita]